MRAPSGSSISNAGGADFFVSGGNATINYDGTITDDVGTLVNVASTTGGTKSFDWTVSLDRAGVTSQTVAWAVSGSGAHAADGGDLVGGVLPSGTLTFAAGETTKSFLNWLRF